MTDRTTSAVILIRFLTGAVFLSEGIQKFLYPSELGVGRFAKIGIPAPQVMAPFVGYVEIICGGFWSMAHEARTDWCMLLGSLFLVIAGGGRWSVDATLSRKQRRSS